MTDVDVVPTVGSAAPATEGLFTRKSSGLVRELGVRDTFGVVTGSVSPGNIAILLFIFLATYPQGDFTIPMLVGGAASILLVILYAQLVSVFPRSGGDYIFAGRVLHPVVGAAIGGAVFVAVVSGWAAVGVLLVQQLIPFFCTAVGEALHWGGLQGLADNFGAKDTQFITLLIVLGLMGSLAVMRTKRVAQFLLFACIAAGLAMVAFSLLLLTHSHGDFVRAFNDASGSPDAYKQVLANAHAAGVKTGFHLSEGFTAIPFGVLTYLGITFAVFPGGEIKRPARTVLVASILTLLVVFVLGEVFWLTLKHTLGAEFLQASGALSVSDPDAYGKATSVPGFAPGYVLLLAGDPITQILAGVGMLLSPVVALLTGLLVVSRLAFALSFDRLLPTWVTKVSPRSHAPYVAIGAGTLGLAIFGYIVIYTSVATAFRNLTLIFLVVYTLASLAATILPWRRPELFAASPKVLPGVGRRNGIVIVGAVSTVVSAVLTYFAATTPQVSGGYDTASIVTLVVTALIGVLAFTVSYVVMRRRGLALSMAMKELPPE